MRIIGRGAGGEKGLVVSNDSRESKLYNSARCATAARHFSIERNEERREAATAINNGRSLKPAAVLQSSK